MFIERLLELISEKGISRKQFNDDVQINKNQLKRWETAGTIPNRTTLAVIAQYFGVSVEYLLGETDERAIKKENSPETLSEGEKALIELFRRVPPDKQELVLDMINLALKKS